MSCNTTNTTTSRANQREGSPKYCYDGDGNKWRAVQPGAETRAFVRELFAPRRREQALARAQANAQARSQTGLAAAQAEPPAEVDSTGDGDGSPGDDSGDVPPNSEGGPPAPALDPWILPTGDLPDSAPQRAPEKKRAALLARMREQAKSGAAEQPAEALVAEPSRTDAPG